MADNVNVTPGVGKTIAADDVLSVYFQKIKLDAGGDGVSVPIIAGSQSASASVPVTSSTEDVARIGSITEAAPSTDTGSSGINGRLQRVAQRLTSLITLLPTALGAGGGLKVDGSGVALPVSLASMPSGTNSTQVQGAIPHASPASGNPILLGGYAVSSEPTAVPNADVARLLTDLVGKLIVLPYSNPENFVNGTITTAMTGTVSTALLSAPGAGLRNYITTIVVSNSHASVGTDVIIQDMGTTGTIMVIPAAAVYGGATITLPTPLKQPTTNAAINCANVTTGANVKVSVVGYKGA